RVQRSRLARRSPVREAAECAGVVADVGQDEPGRPAWQPAWRGQLVVADLRQPGQEIPVALGHPTEMPRQVRRYLIGRHCRTPLTARPTGLTVSPMPSILATSVWPLCR